MVVIIVVCAILILVILSQNPKGGGLSSTFGGGGMGGGQMFGVQRTNEFLDKATWTLAIIITVLCIVANVLVVNPYTTQTDIDTVPIELPETPAQSADDSGATSPVATPPESQE